MARAKPESGHPFGGAALRLFVIRRPFAKRQASPSASRRREKAGAEASRQDPREDDRPRDGEDSGAKRLGQALFGEG
jgi:hypothetical protein